MDYSVFLVSGFRAICSPMPQSKAKRRAAEDAYYLAFRDTPAERVACAWRQRQPLLP